MLQITNKPSLRKLVLVLDGTLVASATGLSYGAHSFLRDWIPLLKDPPIFSKYALLMFFAIPIWLVLADILGLTCVFEKKWSQSRLLWLLIKQHLLGLLALGLILFVTQMTMNRSIIGLFLISSFILLFVERSIFQARLMSQHRKGHGRKHILLVGDLSQQMFDFTEQANSSSLPPSFVGRIGSKSDNDKTSLKYLGELSCLDNILHEEAVDSIVFFYPNNGPLESSDALSACESLGIPAYFCVEPVDNMHSPPRLAEVFKKPFVVFDVSPKSATTLTCKHAFDVIASAIGLILLSPLLLFICAAILITMGRPIFFSQERTGLNGRVFKMLKFRSMVQDAEAKKAELQDANEMSGPVFKVTSDPRITRLGQFLRNTSIDELPQLLNVVSGSMSLIGPRPLPCSEQKQIRGWQRRRLSMRPGITGLWQVSGRSDIDFEQWMRLDLRYVDEWSLLNDLIILFKTVAVVLGQKGAR